MTRAYLDWAAGAPLHPAAREALERVLSLGVGNPSSIHAEGRAAKALLEHAREKVAALAGCLPAEVVFTSSGSEANAQAILGGALGRVLVGTIEHASVRLAARVALGAGVRVVDLPCDPDGRYDIAAAAHLILETDRPVTDAPDSAAGARGGAGVLVAPGERREAQAGAATRGALVAVQLANNETGALQPVEELSALARDAGADVHVDAVQAAGKVDLAPVWQRCSSLALSAHKLGGVAGAGALCVRRGTSLSPRVPGHQERGLRGGTHSLAAIAAFGAVAEAALRERVERSARLAAYGSRLESIVRMADGQATIQASRVPRVPGIVSATFPGVDGETLLVALDLAGVAAAHGAACSTGAMEPSHVLLAMGLSPALAKATVRFSVGPATTDADLDRLEQVLPGAVKAARFG